MVMPIILASGSSIRAELLRKAGVTFTARTPHVDEDALKKTMIGENAPPRDIADALAEMKAGKISAELPEPWVIGCDQVLDFKGGLLSKPNTPEQAIDQLEMMRSNVHTLFSAAVIFQGGAPVWRHVGQARLQMRDVSDAYIADYVKRNWGSIRHSVGAYLLEQEGVRLFARIEGDYFSVLGMPLLEILNFLMLRGVIAR